MAAAEGAARASAGRQWAMARAHLVLPALLVPALVLSGWAWVEGRRQRAEVEAALRGEAELLAEAFGPSLALAAAAARELDEAAAARLLDHARLLSRIDASTGLRQADLEAALSAGAAEAVALLGPDGAAEREAGTSLSKIERERIRRLRLRGDEEALIRPEEASASAVVAVVARSRGGAVAVRAAPASFARIDEAALLRSLVGSAGILYVEYRDEPGAAPYALAWDGGDLPEADPGPGARLRGRRVHEVQVPVDSPAGRRSTLRVGLDAAPLFRAAAAAQRRTFLVGLGLALTGLLGVVVTVVMRVRQREREQAARRIAEAEDARRRSERLAAAGALTAGLAHEVRSPLNAISIACQRLERRLAGDPDGRPLATLIHDEVLRLDGVLHSFLDLARPGCAERRSVDLVALAREVETLLEGEADQRGVGVAVVGEVPRVQADRDAVRRALVNLVRNAIEASPPGGMVEIALEADAWAVRLVVRDQGDGLTPEVAGRAFEPFVTGRVNGTGLGLALVRRVAEDHGGTVGLASRAGGGTEASLELPLSGERR